MPRGEGRGSKPTAVEVDPYNPSTYMRFVAVAAVDVLGAHLGHASRKAIAEHVFSPPISPGTLSLELGKAEGPSPEFLGRLERLYLYRRLLLHNGAPWLTSFYDELQRVSARRDGDAALGVPDVGGGARHQAVRIPIGWFYNLANHQPRNSTEAFIQGHALRAFISEARQVAVDARGGADDPSAEQTIEELLAAFRLTEKARNTVNYLLQVVAGPPHTGLPAVRLLASFGGLALPRVQDFIFRHPAGFRAIRVLGRILDGPRAEALRDQVEPLLKLVYEENPPDPYPARSLLVEALRFAPRGVDEWPWVTQALVHRALDPDRPTRERVYAAYVLFDREKFAEARDIMMEFKASADEGLTYAAAFLSVLFKRKDRVRTYYAWPYDRQEHAIVDGATTVLKDDRSVPGSVGDALRMMVQGALLTIDGTARRSICEAIQAAGLGVSAVGALSEVIRDEASPWWLIEHAAFIAGYLQTGYPVGAGNTVATLVPLVRDGGRFVGHAGAAIRHAALWGIGDIVGSVEYVKMLEEDWAGPGTGRSSRVNAERELLGLVDACSLQDEAVEVRRAAAYAAAMLARRLPLLNKKQETTAVSRILQRIAQDDDALTRRLGLWGQGTENARLHGSYLATELAIE